MGSRYLLLMRHAAGFKPYHSGEGDEVRSIVYPGLLLGGEREAVAVALRLHETLAESRPPIEIMDIWRSTEPEAEATAQIVKDNVDGPDPIPMTELAPGHFVTSGGPKAASALEALVEEIKKATMTSPTTSEAESARLLVGHEPHMGWIAHQLSKRSIPMRRAEILCLKTADDGKTWRLVWTIAPDDKAALDAMREKVKSKMDTAKILGGFITGLVTFVLTKFLDSPRVNNATFALRVATVALLLTSAALYFGSLFQYDTLLMPPRFWGSDLPGTKRPGWLVARPPSSSAWVVYQNVTRIWNRTFLPATCMVGLGIVTFAQSLLEPADWRDWWVIPASIAGAMVVRTWLYIHRPLLGAQD